MTRQKIQNSPFLFDENDNIVGFKQSDSTETLLHGLPEKTPVNAVAATGTIAAADLAVLVATDTVAFDGSTFTRVASDPGAGEFSNATELAALIDALSAWTGAEDTGAVVITAATKGNTGAETVTISHLADTTSGGGESAKAAATIAAADIAQLAVGDTVAFDGSVFTMAAETSAEGNAFADTAGFISCIDAMEDWTAVEVTGDIGIEAAANGAASNDKPITLIYRRGTTAGVNGTEGMKNEICADGSYLYHCIGTNTISGANWRRIARGDVYLSLIHI